MASTKKRKSPAPNAPAPKAAKPKSHPDAADKAAGLVDDLQDDFKEVVEGARTGMIAARERGEQLVTLVQAKKLQVARHFYDIGKALAELQREKLYVALGKKSFAQLLIDRQLLGLSQAKKLIAIAESFDRAKALELGTEKAYALVRMARTTPEDDTPEQLAAGSLRVAGKTKKASALSAAEIDRAARELQAKTAPSRTSSPEEKASRSAARSLQASLRRAGAKGATIEAKRIAGEWKLVVTVAAAHAELLERLVGTAR